MNLARLLGFNSMSKYRECVYKEVEDSTKPK